MQRKQNLSSFDVSQLCRELNAHLQTTRINYITNISQNSYQIKLASSALAIEQSGLALEQYAKYEKYKLIIQPGIRMNLTEFDQTVGQPTNTCLVIRSKITDKLVLGVQQLNFDRTVVMAIGKQTVEFYLIAELFGKGNLILTDERFTVIAVQNAFKTCRVGMCYMQNQQGVTFAQIRSNCNLDSFKGALELSFNAKGQANQLRYLIAKEFYIGGPAASMIIRHCGLAAGVKTKNLSPEETQKVWLKTAQLLELLIQNNLDAENREVPAFVYFYSPEEVQIDGDVDPKIVESLRLAEFYPADVNTVFPGQYRPECCRSFKTLNQTLDQYFSMLETCAQHQSQCQLLQKQENKQSQLVQENEQRVQLLVKEAQQLQLKAKLVFYYQDFVTKYLGVLNKQFDAGNITWRTLGQQMQIQMDPIFQFLDSVDLVQRVFTLRLVLKADMYHDLDYSSNAEIAQILQTQSGDDLEPECSNTEFLDDRIITVQFKLEDSAGKLAKDLFTKASVLLTKAGKTEAQSQVALERIKQQQKPQQDQNQQLRILQKQSTPAWFEKFHWFVSSDGYLVVGGRDAQQNEILVKRFMSPSDLFVHADVHGAPCVVVKMQPMRLSEDGPEFTPRIPPAQTLIEAATLSVAHSYAWEQKAAHQAYYVFRDQVSKAAPTGQFVSTGSFVIRGKKNYIQVETLKFGIGVLWKYQDSMLFADKRLRREENLAFYNEQFAHKDDAKEVATEDVDDKTAVVQTQKKKVVVVLAKDAAKEAGREQKKKEKKVRLEKIKAQKRAAKMRRLEREGRTDVIEKIQQSKNVVETQQYSFCILCQSLAHNYEDCEQAELFDQTVKRRLPPILFNLLSDQLKARIDGEASSDGEERPEDSAADQEELAGEAGQEAPQKQNENLSKPINFLSPELKAELEPSCAIMVGPVSAFAGFECAIQITTGPIQRGQSFSQIQQIFLKMMKDNAFATMQLKNVPEHAIIMAVPGAWQLDKGPAGK